MPFQPGQSGNPEGRRIEKPFADALRMELAYIERGEDTPAPKGSLRWNVRQLLEKGDVPAIKEIADRLDGKVPQGIIGGSPDDPPISAEFTGSISATLEFVARALGSRAVEPSGGPGKG